jgi:hypothetical protein
MAELVEAARRASDSQADGSGASAPSGGEQSAAGADRRPQAAELHGAGQLGAGDG